MDFVIINSSPITYFIQRKNLSKDLIIIEAFEVDRTGSARCHAETAAFAKYRIDLGPAGKGHILFKRRGFIRTNGDTDTAGAAIHRVGHGHRSAHEYIFA